MTTFAALAPLADHAHEWGHGAWWPIWPLLWIALLGTAVWFVVRRTRGGRTRDPFDRAREVLAERFAGGEITADEYRERLDQLR